MKIHCLAAAIAVAAAMPASAETLLNPVFSDHAVLQRGAPIKVWGTTTPGASVKVTLSSQSAEAQAAADGRWQAELPAMDAGGPYVLTAAASGQTESVSDVLVGDVYLCSGQSNMAMAVKDTIDSGAEIQISANNSIRLMTVANQTSTTPLAVLPVTQKWVAASPATVPAFSGTCYYFARELQKSVNVPLGLIDSAWGGANITSYMSTAALAKLGGNEARLDALAAYAADPAQGMKRWGEVIENYWKSQGSEPWRSATPSWPAAPAGMSYWTDWKVPELAHYTGHVWFRTQVTLSAEQAAQDAQLALGSINEEDQTWVNGRFLASTFAFGAPRTYTVPAGSLKAGANDILVDVYCSWRGCGMFGAPDARVVKFKDGSSTPLSGPWQYEIEKGTTPRIPWGATAGLGMAFNAMIAPLAPYGLKGVLWYQGESNTGAAAAYRAQLRGLMDDWRGLFGAPLPFMIVQLPDYGVPPIKPEDSDWASLRESQRLAVNEDGNAALAVTIDIGDHFGLHPGNKQEVGRRLSVAARHLIYKDAIALTGPAPVAATRIKGGIAVKFTGFSGKLVAYNAADPIGFELCDARTCTFAKATIRGDSVQLSPARRFTPTHVRYCWADGPVCTLYDAARMPAVPFDIPVKSSRKHR